MAQSRRLPWSESGWIVILRLRTCQRRDASDHRQREQEDRDLQRVTHFLAGNDAERLAVDRLGLADSLLEQQRQSCLLVSGAEKERCDCQLNASSLRADRRASYSPSSLVRRRGHRRKLKVDRKDALVWPVEPRLDDRRRDAREDTGGWPRTAYQPSAPFTTHSPYHQRAALELTKSLQAGTRHPLHQHRPHRPPTQAPMVDPRQARGRLSESSAVGRGRQG